MHAFPCNETKNLVFEMKYYSLLENNVFFV